MFYRKYDLIVAGAGVAGIAAALAAARRGVHVVLIEKTVWTGGLATSGIINVYLPLCDGNGTQVSFGITEEMLQRSLKYSPGTIPDWKKARNGKEIERYRTAFSPAGFVLSLDEMLEEVGVEVWFDTVIVDAEAEGNRLKSITVGNKSGLGKLEAACFIDATGDSDLAFFAGDKVHQEPNASASWALERCGAAPNKLTLTDQIQIKMLGYSYEKNAYEPGVNGALVSRFIQNGRKRYRNTLDEDYASGKYDRNTRYPLLVPTMPELRHTRCFDAPFALQPGMDWTHFDDSVGLCADWRKPGMVWEIPYRTLLSRRLENLLAAGRCTAAHGDAWEVTRVIPVAAETGEVAGVAAALSLNYGICPAELTPGCGKNSFLESELRTKCGFPLHFEDLGLVPHLSENNEQK